MVGARCCDKTARHSSATPNPRACAHAASCGNELIGDPVRSRCCYSEHRRRTFGDGEMGCVERLVAALRSSGECRRRWRGSLCTGAIRQCRTMILATATSGERMASTGRSASRRRRRPPTYRSPQRGAEAGDLNARGLERRDKRPLLGDHVRGGVVEVIAVTCRRAGGEQGLGTSRAETIDEPEDASAHQSSSTSPRLRAHSRGAGAPSGSGRVVRIGPWRGSGTHPSRGPATRSR
jgi:hypothetical protein